MPVDLDSFEKIRNGRRREYGVDGHFFINERLEDAGVDIYGPHDEFRHLSVTEVRNCVEVDVSLATGFNDVRPEPPLPRTGRGLHYCLHCDAHMFVDESVYVMGHAESAAHVAAIMLNFTDEVDLLTRGNDPEWSEETAQMLENHPIDVVHDDVSGVQNGEDGWLEALKFEDGTVREYKGGFAMYGAEYNNGLARELGCDINDDGTIEVDDHGRTSVDDVYAVGDCTPGHNQIPVALGQGAKAGIDIHFQLRDFPRDPELLEEQGPVRSEEVPGIPDELLEQAVDFHTYGE